MSIRNVLDDPKRMAQVHAGLAILWLLLTIVTTVSAVVWPESGLMIPWLVFMSGYAIVASHWSAREGAAPSAPSEEKS